MIDTHLKEIIVAYFQGGNATGQNNAGIKHILEVIKDFTSSNTETSNNSGFIPERRLDSRNSSR